jgi:hypothetical protein
VGSRKGTKFDLMSSAMAAIVAMQFYLTREMLVAEFK